MKPLLIVGAGGLGGEALWVAREMNVWDCLGFADDDERRGPLIAGAPILGRIAHIRDSIPPVWFHCAIGNNEARKRVFEEYMLAGWSPATLIHPSVIVGPNAHVGEGSYLAAGSVLCPNTTLGRGVLVNNHVSVGHDSSVGAFSQLCPGARVSGNCELGELVFMGSNAVVSQGLRVGDRAAIGASSFANREVPADQIVVGVPARPRLTL